jgi:hypothetical protein
MSKNALHAKQSAVWRLRHANRLPQPLDTKRLSGESLANLWVLLRRSWLWDRWVLQGVWAWPGWVSVLERVRPGYGLNKATQVQINGL